MECINNKTVDIRYTDILASVTNYLEKDQFQKFEKNKGEGVRIVEVPKDFPRPSFFTKLNIIETIKDKQYVDDKVQIIIHYFPKSEHINEIENLDMKDEFKRFFLVELEGLFEIKKEKFEIEDFELRVTDGVAQCDFQLQINQEILEKDMELMQNLVMDNTIDETNRNEEI